MNAGKEVLASTCLIELLPAISVCSGRASCPRSSSILIVTMFCLLHYMVQLNNVLRVSTLVVSFALSVLLEIWTRSVSARMVVCFGSAMQGLRGFAETIPI